MSGRSLNDALNKFAQNQQAVAGIRTDVAFDAGSNISPGYLLPKPKTGLIATLFPSDNTWHPLFKHDYSEITENLVAIEAAELPDTQTRELQEQVAQTVKDSYVVRAKAGFYMSCILFVVILLIFAAYSTSTGKWFHKGLIAVGIGALLVAASAIYINYVAKGKGESYWAEYSADLAAKMRSGQMLHEILKQYDEQNQRDMDRNVMALAQRQTEGLRALLYWAA